MVCILQIQLYFIQPATCCNLNYNTDNNNDWYNFKRILLNHAPTSTQLHPPPPTSIHLHPASSSLHSALGNSLNVIRTKMLHVIRQSPQIQAKYSKLSVLTENWNVWYLGGAVSKSGLRYLKFQPQNSFLGKFGSKKSKVSVLPEN